MNKLKLAMLTAVTVVPSVSALTKDETVTLYKSNVLNRDQAACTLKKLGVSDRDINRSLGRAPKAPRSKSPRSKSSKRK